MTQASGAPGGGIVVVGGGISGVTAAVEAAEAGHEVFLLEREAFLGGRVSRLNQYFPKLCPPSCGLEINFRRIKQNPKIRVFTLAEVIGIEGQPGAYTVSVKITPRRVNANCTACNACVEACPEERDDAFNLGMRKTKAIYRSHDLSYPASYVIDSDTCPGASCSRCLAYCAYDAIELDEQPRTMTLQAATVVVATGWKPYAAGRLANLGFGTLPNVVSNVMVERMACKEGPTGGKLQRPSDGAELKKVAFVQCAGSRDENHLGFCSMVCCAASLKQATYVREQYPDAEIHIFYIDIRTPGILEDFAARVQTDDKIFLHKGKVAKITRAPQGPGIRVISEETLSGTRLERDVDMAVLATGMQPEEPISGAVEYDDYGFVAPGQAGIHGAGCAKHPVEVAASVQDGTAAALHAIQDISRR